MGKKIESTVGKPLILNLVSLLLPGFTRQPKWGHLKELHAAIKLCSKTILSKEQTIVPLDQLHLVRVQPYQATNMTKE